MGYKLFCLFVLLGCVLYVQGQHYKLKTSDRYAVVGSPFTFTCRGNGSPIITWFVINTEYRMKVQGKYGHCEFYGEHPKEYMFFCSDDINILIIKSVKLSQHGTVWRYGDDGGHSNEIKLEVRDGPGTSLKLTNSSVVTAVEGSDVTASCSSTCFITCNYQWKLADDVISNTSILSLANIDRTKSGLYVCTAENPDTNQIANQTLHLTVLHGPGSSLRVNSSSNITVEEGSDVRISCKADCFIKCLYRWELTNQIVSNNGLLALTSITRRHDGVYTCTAINPDTNKTAHKRIIINVESAVEDSSQFGKGFAIGFGTFFLLSVIIIIVVIIYLRYKRKTNKPISNQQRISTNQQVYYSLDSVTDTQTAPEIVHQDTENTYSSLDERGNDVPYDVLMPDNNQAEPAAVHEDISNSYSSLEDRGYEIPYDVSSSLIVNETI